jgi:hypothetical protein
MIDLIYEYESILQYNSVTITLSCIHEMLKTIVCEGHSTTQTKLLKIPQSL